MYSCNFPFLCHKLFLLLCLPCCAGCFQGKDGPFVFPNKLFGLVTCLPLGAHSNSDEQAGYQILHSGLAPGFTVSRHSSPFHFLTAENSLYFHLFLSLDSLKTLGQHLYDFVFILFEVCTGIRVTCHPCLWAALLAVLVSLAFGIYLQNHLHIMISRPPSLVNSVLNLVFRS